MCEFEKEYNIDLTKSLFLFLLYAVECGNTLYVQGGNWKSTPPCRPIYIGSQINSKM